MVLRETSVPGTANCAEVSFRNTLLSNDSMEEEELLLLLPAATAVVLADTGCGEDEMGGVADGTGRLAAGAATATDAAVEGDALVLVVGSGADCCRATGGIGVAAAAVGVAMSIGDSFILARMLSMCSASLISCSNAASSGSSRAAAFDSGPAATTPPSPGSPCADEEAAVERAGVSVTR